MKRAALLYLALAGCSTFGEAVEPVMPDGAAGDADVDAVATDASAADSRTGSDGGPPDPGKLVFVTKGLLKIAANFVTVADNLCNTEGTAARPSATFVAWLSIPGANAIDRLPAEGRWTLANRKDVVFPGKASVTSGALGHEIDEHADESSVMPATQLVWTNTKGDGTAKTSDVGFNCQNFSSANTGLFARVGRPAETVSSQWTDDKDLACDQQAAIICFEK